ncbi:MAG: bifunctional demethylmenaquinone methyltransferase/2-methoxy-6-polyprenyl-1,4-benzoquinol methylase UbiE [Alphaproteobacteria bacterium]|nr:MAG: bifunctional demethylmenaquinone methyltransferase/2-methoxy-6-polyprenyl-1,4-benzoquinol methylase UbiE [Alphaproteobacteria bacterium]
MLPHMIDEIKQKDTADTTHFGFKTVDKQSKQALVRNVFDSVAEKYDIMNDVMSGGLHRLWKNDMIRVMRPEPGMTLLDVAGGTGDIAFRFLDAAKKRERADSPAAEVTVCDINASMLEVGRDRAIDRGILRNIDWVCGNAEGLSFPDNSFDVYTIAFGIRNVTNIDKALAEAYRVLKPGGRFLCLEFSKVNTPLLRKIYDSYSFHILPRFGEMITGDRKSYQYLVESIRQFPTQDKFKSMISEAGFSRVTYRNMTGGVVALHSGWKI